MRFFRGSALWRTFTGYTSPRVRGEVAEGSVQSFSHIWFGLSGARHWLKR
jgi:hypothetical protein